MYYFGCSCCKTPHSVPQYQVSSSTSNGAVSEHTETIQSKQNGKTPGATTTIHIPSGSVYSSGPGTAPTNSNGNNNSTVGVARTRGLPTSAAKFLSDVLEPVCAPADSEIVHVGQDAAEWERRKAWRECKEKEPEKEVHRVQALLPKVDADTKDKPSSDTEQ